MALPEGILDYFELTDFSKSEDGFKIYLAEKNILPEEFASDKLSSKVFYDEITIQDSLMRSKAAYQHIKRRRWIYEPIGDIVYRIWNMASKRHPHDR